MKHIILSFILFSILSSIKAQEFFIVDLENKIIHDINSSNDSVICNIISPNPRNEISKHIFPYASLQSRLSQDLPQWYIDETDRLMKERNLHNDYRTNYNYVIFINNDLIEIKKYETFIKYIYSEGCEIDKYVIVKNLITNNYDDLIGVFSSDIITNEQKTSYILIKDSTEWYLKPNRAFTTENYRISYTALLSENHQNFENSGSIFYSYLNTELVVKNLQNNITQTLFKVPQIYILGLKSILIADINNDGKDDIILTTFDELCKFNLIYLTTSNNENLFDFVGYSMECDCP